MADESLRDYGLAVPHGPNMTGEHTATQSEFHGAHNMDGNENSVFQTILKPDDMYNDDGVYWADLPLMKKVKFVLHNEGKESKRELKVIGSMIKKDPLSPVSFYFRNMVIPGLGLGLEG